MVDIIGIDPSMRHTGLALLKGGKSLLLDEIKPKTSSIVEASLEHNALLQAFLNNECSRSDKVVIAIERQIVRASPLLFHSQVNTMMQLHAWFGSNIVGVVQPYPVQLRSYLVKVMRIKVDSKSAIVDGFKKSVGAEYAARRISSHCVEAYYLTRLAQDVLDGRWFYDVGKKEAVKVHSWGVFAGGVNGTT